MRVPLPCLFLAAALAAITVASAADDFVVIALPDTQYYSSGYPQIYSAQTQWVADNASALNIGFVTHLGDFVNNHDRDFQWTNAESAMDTLDLANIPWGGIPGNHDFLYGDGADDFTGSRYIAKFGPQRFADKPWYGGASPSKLSNYQVIDFGPNTILFLHLNMETPAAELTWAQTVLNQHPDKPVFVSTHRYLQDAEDYGIPLISSGRFPGLWYTFEPLYRPDGMQADDFFNGFVRGNRNIFIVHCGHFHEEFYQASFNNFGLPVHEILADYQDDPNGGDGWLRILNFRPDQDQIFIQTFSPTFADAGGSYRTGSDSQFTINIDLDDYATPLGDVTLSFRNGLDGYTGTRDTWVNSDTDAPLTDTSFGNEPLIVVDNDWDDSPLGDDPTHGMLRFENTFQPPVHEGDPEPTRIPTNATITSANLFLNFNDDIDGGNEDLLVHVCNRDWDENSTWNSLGNGLSDDLGTLLAVVPGDNEDPTIGGGITGRNADVTAAVQAWAGGSPNHGFALIPENTLNIDDGMEINSSEHPSLYLRPALDVSFDYTVLNSPPVITPLAASRTGINEGESVVLSLSAGDPNPSDPLTLRLNGGDLAFGVGTAQFSEVIVFDQNGSFPFSSEVLDDESNTPGGSVTITVHNVAPTLTNLTNNLEVAENEPFNFEATATDPGPLDILSYDWDLDDDGSYDDATGSSGSHSFASLGIHTISLRVSDGDGGEAFGSFDVTVGDPYLAWAATNGVTGGPDDDHDGDGMSNEAERILQYDPLDPNDRLVLEIESINPATGMVSFRYSEVKPLGTYKLFRSPDATAPRDSWTEVPTGEVTPDALQEPYEQAYDVRTFATEPRGFYQIRFIPAP